MREIKFRAWDKEKSIMLEGDTTVYIYNEDGSFDFNTRYWDEEADDRRGEWKDKSHDNCIIMQYTGLKDKKGEEIYEGDITLSKYGQRGGQYLIVDHLSEYGVVFNRVYGGGMYFYRDVPQRDTLEVIGNIYENKELLE